MTVSKSPSGPIRYLIVRGRSTSMRMVLPHLGTLTIGSARACDLRIKEPDVEEEHASLFLDHGIGLRINASDSAKIEAREGKELRERALEVGKTIDLELGDRIRLGGAELVFASSEAVVPAARFVMRKYFEERTRSAAVEDRSLSAVVRLKIAGEEDIEKLDEALRSSVRANDLITALGDREYAVLLNGVTDTQARGVVASITDALMERGSEVLSGLVRGDEGASEDLLDVALERMARPTMGGERARSVVSNDPAMETVQRMIDRVARSATHVLILGETGVGKDLIAQLIHDRSDRASGPFVRVNCVDLSDSFLEEASSNFIARAKGGTVHLDEIGGLSARAQLSLGYLLDQAPTASHDVRFLASSNQDLMAAVNAGSFRKDLFFRLNQLTIQVPPLRERTADIVLLAEAFVIAAMPTNRRLRPARLSEQAKVALSQYNWPGNVRELRNVIERALLLCQGDVLGLEHLPTEILGGSGPVVLEDRPMTTSFESSSSPEAGGDKPRSLREEIEALEKKRILEALQKYPTQRDAAAALDMPMRTFLNRLDAFGIPRARGGGGGKTGE
jgi:DNA-binding NtrC family response regulator